MLPVCSVDTPIHINRSQLLALRVRVHCELGLKFHREHQTHLGLKLFFFLEVHCSQVTQLKRKKSLCFPLYFYERQRCRKT